MYRKSQLFLYRATQAQQGNALLFQPCETTRTFHFSNLTEAGHVSGYGESLIEHLPEFPSSGQLHRGGRAVFHHVHQKLDLVTYPPVEVRDGLPDGYRVIETQQGFEAGLRVHW